MVTPYQNFYESLKTPDTRKSYQIYMNQFLDYAHTDYDGLAKLPQNEINDLIFHYIVHLKDLTERTGTPSPNSYNPMISPIKKFLVMNDIILNWDKIKSWYPEKVAEANQMPYDSKDIKELLEATTNIRNKAFIHFLASTGCRIGAIPKLNIEDVKPIENGAIVTIQRDTTQEYRTCLTPEAYDCLKRYLAQRLNVRPIDPLFTDKGNITRIGLYGARDMIRNIRFQAKLSVDNGGRKSTKGKSQNHAFRKRVVTSLSKVDVQQTFVEYFVGHFTKQNKYYFRGAPDEDLWNQFKKAIPALTIDVSEKTKAEYERKELKYRESYEGELKEKLESLESKMIEMEMGSAMKEWLYLDGIFNMQILDEITPEKLKKTFHLSVLEEWNNLCDKLGKEYPPLLERKIPISQSEIYQEKIQNVKGMKHTIKILKEGTECYPERIAEIEQNFKNRAKEWNLDYEKYK